MTWVKQIPSLTNCCLSVTWMIFLAQLCFPDPGSTCRRTSGSIFLIDLPETMFHLQFQAKRGPPRPCSQRMSRATYSPPMPLQVFLCPSTMMGVRKWVLSWHWSRAKRASHPPPWKSSLWGKRTCPLPLHLLPTGQWYLLQDPFQAVEYPVAVVRGVWLNTALASHQQEALVAAQRLLPAYVLLYLCSSILC